MIKYKQITKGFTLVELILYIALAAILLLSVFSLFWLVVESRIKNQTMAEVDQQGIQIIQVITQDIRNAESVNYPTVGNSASELSLDIIDGTKDPTIFDILNDTLQIKEGTANEIEITSSRIRISDLEFQNSSRNGTSDTIKIKFTLSHANPENKNEYNYSKTFYGSATIR